MSSQGSLSPIKRHSIYEQVVEHLKQHIIENRLAPGDRLPTESELAQSLNVSRLSVREALKVMESLGILQSKTRDGTRLREPTMRPVADHLRFLVDVSQVTVDEIGQARQVMECALIPLVIANARDEDFARLEKCIEDMQAAVDAADLEGILLSDLNFHRALLQAARNRAIEGFAVMLQDFFHHKDLLWRASSGVNHQQSVEWHREIFAALRAGDETLAVERMRGHFKPYLDRLGGTP